MLAAGEQHECPGGPLLSRANGHVDLDGPQTRILNAVAWLEALGVEAPEQSAVAFMAGYRMGGGAFKNPRGRLKQRGLIEYANGHIRLTDAGREVAAPPDIPHTNEALHDRVLDRLDGPEQRILRVLLDAYPTAVEMNELAAGAGYEPTGGAFKNPRGRLRTLGLVEYPESGMVRARDLLFPEGR